jgi:hypothetical protein
VNQIGCICVAIAILLAGNFVTLEFLDGPVVTIGCVATDFFAIGTALLLRDERRA